MKIFLLSRGQLCLISLLDKFFSVKTMLKIYLPCKTGPGVIDGFEGKILHPITE